VAKFVSAWKSANLAALVALLADEVFISMPPMPFEYQGRDLVARFCACSAQAAGSTSSRREPTASQHSALTCVPHRHRPVRPRSCR
jgi:hypothetical protein